MNFDPWLLCTNCMEIHATTTLCSPKARKPDATSGYHSESDVGQRLARRADEVKENFEFTEADLEGCPCQGTGWLALEWLEKREPRCTCGGGDPADPNTFHSLDCDTVPCPFCQLETT